MDKAAKGGNAEETGFDLKKGELNAQSPVKTRLNLGGGVTLTTDEASQYTLKRTKDGYEIDSVTGDLKVERDGAEPATVPGGRVAVVPVKGAVKSDEVPKEAVQLPARAGMKIFHTATGRFAITWEGEPDKPYKVEVSNDPAYKHEAALGRGAPALRQRAGAGVRLAVLARVRRRQGSREGQRVVRARDERGRAEGEQQHGARGV